MAIVNEMSVMAKTHNIPVVTASQLNRDSYRKLEEAADKKADKGKSLNQSNVGDSMLIVENTDIAIILNKELQVSTDKEYLSMKRVKMRGKEVGPSYINYEFENGMKLKEDYNTGENYCVKSLSDELENFNPNSSSSNNNLQPKIKKTKSKNKKLDMNNNEGFNLGFN